MRGLGSLKAKHRKNSRTVIPIRIEKKAEKEPKIERIIGLDLHPDSDL